MKRMENAKRILARYRAENPNRKKMKYPTEFWKEAIKLAEKIPIQEIAEELDINIGNFQRRIKEAGLGKVRPPKKSKEQNFLEIPMTAPVLSGKSITLELPHNVRLRIEL